MSTYFDLELLEEDSNFLLAPPIRSLTPTVLNVEERYQFLRVEPDRLQVTYTGRGSNQFDVGVRGRLRFFSFRLGALNR